jgi:hypothetical protein
MKQRFYLLGIVLSILIAISAFFIINQVDSQFLTSLAKQVEKDSLESDSARLSIQFVESLGTENRDQACQALRIQIDNQISQTYSILEALKDSKSILFMGDATVLKQKYFISNANLYLDLKKLDSLCGEKTDYILYFYNSQSPCPDCEVQGTVLDNVRQSCPTVRVFAFPVDESLSLVKVLAGTFQIETAPSMVINEKTIFTKLTTAEEIRHAIPC